MRRKLALLTSARAVRAAVSECDELGRDNFLKRYGYKYSRRYPLVYGGRTLRFEGNRWGSVWQAARFAIEIGRIFRGSQNGRCDLGKTWVYETSKCASPLEDSRCGTIIYTLLEKYYVGKA